MACTRWLVCLVFSRTSDNAIIVLYGLFTRACDNAIVVLHGLLGLTLMNHDILAFAVMLRGLQAFKREKQQLRRAQRKAVERNKSAALEYALGCGCLT